MKKFIIDRAGCDRLHRGGDTRIERGRFNRHRVWFRAVVTDTRPITACGYYPCSYHPYGAP